MSAMRSASRRDFLTECLSGAVLGASGTVGRRAPSRPAPVITKSKVVIAHDDQLRDAGSAVDSHRVLGLLDRAMQSLLDRDQPIEAWKRLVRPGDRVGLKVNALGGRGLASNLQLVEAICGRLQQAGVRANDIVVWDRDTEEMERSGFHISTGGNGVLCFGPDGFG